jgi:hypothetical protein
MSEDKVRCTGCGRSFQLHAAAARPHCMYCGGKLAGPGLEHLELVGGDIEHAGRSGAVPSVLAPVLEGGGPSRWDRPVTALHELSVLAIMLMIPGVAIHLLYRDDPLITPHSIRLSVLAALPLLWMGGLCLRTGVELFTGPTRSVVAAVPLLVPGLFLGLPSAVARTLARLQGRVFGLWGFAATLALFLGTTVLLGGRHDPVSGVAAWMARQPENPSVDPSWEPSPTGWTGRMIGNGEGAFSMSIDEAEGGRWRGDISWVRSGRVDTVEGVYQGNHLACPYPGPPWVERWWKRPGMLSTLELLVVADRQLIGRDRVFGYEIEGQRAWQRQEPDDADQVRQARSMPLVASSERAPLVEPPTVLRPAIALEDRSITRGRAFALLLPTSGDAVILTAASLFGPPGGLPRTLNPQMLPALVGEASFFDLLEGSMRARGELERPPSGARATLHSDDGPPDPSRDLVSFQLLPGHNLRPLELRQEPIFAEQGLWLPSAPRLSGDVDEDLLAGVVTATWEQGISVRFDVASLEGHIGAPLLDGDGRVAGMVVSWEQASRGSLAIVIPARWIAARLDP